MKITMKLKNIAPQPSNIQFFQFRTRLKIDMLCVYLARLFISFPNFQLTKGHADRVEVLRDARDTSLLLIDQLESQELDQNDLSDHEQRLFERCKKYFNSSEISQAVHVVKSMKEIHQRLQARIDRYGKDILTVWYGNFLRNGKVEDRDFFFLTKLDPEWLEKIKKSAIENLIFYCESAILAPNFFFLSSKNFILY